MLWRNGKVETPFVLGTQHQGSHRSAEEVREHSAALVVAEIHAAQQRPVSHLPHLETQGTRLSLPHDMGFDSEKLVGRELCDEQEQPAVYGLEAHVAVPGDVSDAGTVASLRSSTVTGDGLQSAGQFGMSLSCRNRSGLVPMADPSLLRNHGRIMVATGMSRDPGKGVSGNRSQPGQKRRVNAGVQLPERSLVGDNRVEAADREHLFRRMGC